MRDGTCRAIRRQVIRGAVVRTVVTSLAQIVVATPVNLVAEARASCASIWESTLADAPRLEVFGARGGVVIEGSDIAGEVHARASRTSRSVDPCVVDILATRQSDSLRVVARYPEPQSPAHDVMSYDSIRGDFWHYNVDVNFGFRVSRATAVYVRTFVGDIRVNGVDGSLDVATNDGTIRMTRVSGPVRASVVGDLELHTSANTPGQAGADLFVYTGTARIVVAPGERVRINDRWLSGTRDEEVVVATAPTQESVQGAVVLDRTGGEVRFDVVRGRILLTTRP